MTTGQRIKFYRLRQGMTQTQLGEKLNVNKAAVWKWEHDNVVNLKRETLIRLSEVFGVSIDEIVSQPATNEECNDWNDKHNRNNTLLNEVALIEHILQHLKEHGKGGNELFEYFIRLNSAGRKKAIELVSDLTEMKKYKEEGE